MGMRMALGDRECVDAVLQLLPLDGRAQPAAVVERHAGLETVGARIAGAVDGVRRGVVGHALRGGGGQRGEECRPGLLRILDAREVVVAALLQLDVVLERIVQTVVQRPDPQGVGLRSRPSEGERCEEGAYQRALHGRSFCRKATRRCTCVQIQ